MSTDRTSQALASLLRREASGAAWRTPAVTDRSAGIDLLTCDAGEVVGRLDSSHPDLQGLDPKLNLYAAPSCVVMRLDAG